MMKLIETHQMDLPILTTVYKVLYEDLSPADGLKYLMNRPTKWE